MAGGSYVELYEGKTDWCPKRIKHKFACQPDRKRTVKSSTSNALLKRAKLELVQDVLKNIPRTSKVDLQVEDVKSRLRSI